MKKILDKNILYVEDDLNTQEEISFFLQTFVKNIFVAENGESALEYFHKEKIDLIITDIQMPKMNGIEMIREIKKINTTIPIIILTAFNESKYLLEALNLGVNNYLFKPINLKEIKESILEHLRGDIESLLKCSLNEIGEVIDANENLLHYLEYQKEEILSQPFITLIDEKYQQELQSELKNISRSEFINNLYIELKTKNSVSKEVVLDVEVIKNKDTFSTILSCQLQSVKYLMSSKNNILKLLKQEKSLKDLINTYALIGKSATSIESVKEFFQVVCDYFTQNIEYEFAYITRIEGNSLKIINYSQDQKDDISIFFKEATIRDFQSKNNVMTQAYKSRAISVIENLQEMENYEDKEFLLSKGILSLAAIPLRFNEESEVFAIITLMLKNTHKFIKEEFNLFANIVDMIILGIQAIESKIEKENLLHELYVRATRDFLTNCINRQEGVNILIKEIERSLRYKNKLSLVFFDIDKFKVINDTYGHNVGDKVLISISERIKNSLRTSDYIIRWGGEEFIILLPEIDLDGAIAFTKKIQQQIREMVIDGHSVTVSLGITEYKENEHWEEFVERADQLMYQAKNGGRDQYTSG